MGLFALGAGIFGVTALGMAVMAGIVAVGVAKGELDPSPQVRSLTVNSPRHGEVLLQILRNERFIGTAQIATEFCIVFVVSGLTVPNDKRSSTAREG